MDEGKTDVNMCRFSFWPVFWGQKLTSKFWIILFIHFVYIYSAPSSFISELHWTEHFLKRW